MQINLKREDLLKPLSYVAGVVERRQTLPILSYVLLKQTDGGGTLTGTDLEVEVVAGFKAGGRAEMTLPARKLLDICRALPAEAMLEIKKEGEKAVIKAGRSRYTLLTLPVTDFPNIETSQWEQSLSVPQKDFKRLLDLTQFCMAQQDVRYYLNGLLLELSANRLRAVATDGHRMALSDLELKKGGKGERQVIVPRKGIHEISRLLEDGEGTVELLLSPNHLRVQTEHLTFTSKLIDGRYPDYNKVIPAAQTKQIKIERGVLRETLSRAAILSNEKYRGVRLNLEEKTMKITAHNPEQEEAQEEIAIDYSGEPLEIGFNVSYLIDAVSAHAAEHIILGLSDSNSSCTITAPDDKHTKFIVMPMRL